MVGSKNPGTWEGTPQALLRRTGKKQHEPTACLLKPPVEDFPGSPVVKNLPANAGNKGSITGLGRSHLSQGSLTCGPQLLSPCSRTQEPQLLKSESQSSSTREATTTRSLCTQLENNPCSPQLEKVHVQQRRRSTAKNKRQIHKKKTSKKSKATPRAVFTRKTTRRNSPKLLPIP